MDSTALSLQPAQTGFLVPGSLVHSNVYITGLDRSSTPVLGPGRVAIAGALAQRPMVLLLDELTTFLDGEDQGAVLAAVRALTRPGAGVTALWVRLRC